MQEKIIQGAVTLSVEAGKLTVELLQKAMWTVGISSIPRSVLLRWSIRSRLPFLSKNHW